MTRRVSLEIVSFFSANPTEELLVSDAQTKFDIPDSDSARQVMSRLIRAGWITRKRYGVHGAPTIYVAGGELLKAIGKV